jgi:hypothetical protein
MPLVRFYNIFLGGQVIIGAGVHDHWVVMFVPYFCVENLATLRMKGM